MFREIRAGVRAASAAAQFDIRALKALARQAVGPIPFVGVVEAGLYLNWGPDGPSSHRHVSWHVHLIVWGVTRDELELALEPIRERHRSLLDGSVALVRDIQGRDDLERCIVYALKAPQRAAEVNFFPKA